MPYVTPEQIERSKRMDLLTYLQYYEPQELVRFSGNVYTTRTHDSLKISNGKWCWWSRNIGGRSALDYLIKVRGMTLPEAVLQIDGQSAVMPPVSPKVQKPVEPKKLLLPEKNENVERSANNLTMVKTLIANYLNVRDLLGFDYVIMPLGALQIIEGFLG